MNQTDFAQVSHPDSIFRKMKLSEYVYSFEYFVKTKWGFYCIFFGRVWHEIE